jgi:hypothetical protein
MSASVYTDFFAMKYWTSSFGYLATITGLSLFAAGHLFILIIDGRLQRNLVVRLREKVRKFEIQYGAQMQREDGLFFRLDRNQRDLKKGKVASKKKVYIAKQNQDDVQGLIEEDDRKRPRTKMNKADEADGAPGEEFKQEQ